MSRIKDMSNMRIGKLLVLHKYKIKSTITYWLCKCDCGNTKWVKQGYLHLGTTKSCGCLKLNRRKDIKGMRFGRLLVTGENEVRNKRVYWKCNCDCGKTTWSNSRNLSNKNTTSCGCWNKERSRIEYKLAAKNRLFGEYKTSAKRRKLIFDIDFDSFILLTSSNCFYCNVPPQKIQKGGYGNYNYNGLDRKNNSEGYTLNNAVTCCWRCNQFKSTFHIGDFIDGMFSIYFNQLKNQKSFVILFTGLSGSGKSAIALELKNRLNKLNKLSTILDGDIGRLTYSKGLGFSRLDRIQNNIRAACIASYLEQCGNIVIASYIAPSKEIRQHWNKFCNNLITIHVKCPIWTCESRDPKGLYARVRAGQIKSFTGIHSDAPYEEPSTPELVINTEKESISVSADKVIAYLESHGCLNDS